MKCACGLVLDEDTEQGRYFLSCARIRDISPASLIRRIIHVATFDKLIGAILDDADALRVKRDGERKPNKSLTASR